MFATKGVIYARQAEVPALLEKGLIEGPIETKSFRRFDLPWRSGQDRAVKAAEKFAVKNKFDVMVYKEATIFPVDGIYELKYDFYNSPDRY